MARSFAAGARTPWKRFRCKRGRGTSATKLHILKRRHDDMRGAIPIGALQLQHDLAGAVTLESFVGNGGARDVAAQAFEFLALMGATTHRGVQAEAVRIGAQCWHGGFAAPRDGLHVQHFVRRRAFGMSAARSRRSSRQASDSVGGCAAISMGRLGTFITCCTRHGRSGAALDAAPEGFCIALVHSPEVAGTALP